MWAQSNNKLESQNIERRTRLLLSMKRIYFYPSKKCREIKVWFGGFMTNRNVKSSTKYLRNLKISSASFSPAMSTGRSSLKYRSGILLPLVPNSRVTSRGDYNSRFYKGRMYAAPVKIKSSNYRSHRIDKKNSQGLFCLFSAIANLFVLSTIICLVSMHA